ncbi:uncharacterized protein LOC126382356 [Pectinophora gossypiella]|uniref:uncharacterized protein LOC126382356 n=1 Tax=Pectinophora gossypiella TaxID=13191 RepID=UPI00214E5C13|nr:uncharacterized protein LOC126382356 [Pectinophora gossypiella]
MPRNYQRTTNRQSWSKESMEQAITAWKENKMGWELAAKTFGVPQATLRRHALNKNKNLESSSKGLGRFKPTFPLEIERELVDHIKFLETRLFGLTRTAVQELAFELAEKNGFDHAFNKDKKRAGQEWLESFLKRNPDISLRSPEPTSAARAQAFNRPQVKRFFEIYEEFLNKYKLEPQRVYNMDESGLTTVQKPQKILATKGRKQIGCLTSAERGSNVTVVCCTNAIGSFIPPCMIFPRKNMKNELIDEAPTGTLGLAQESGWMNTDVFVKWLKHFQLYTKASKEDPVLLICDGHASHKTIEALTYAKENGIHMLCLPPHCTHRMQPLDVSIYGPLKTFYNQEISKWLKNHPGRVVTHLQIGNLFAQAYGKAATVQNASNGFKSTGLWPINPDIFPDYMFEPAETTNIPLNQVNVAGTEPEPEPAYERLSPVENENPTPTQADLDNTIVSTLDPLETQNTTTQINAIPEDEERPLTTDVGVTISKDLGTNVQESFTVKSSIVTHDDGMKPGSSKSLEFPIEILSPPPQGQFIRGQGKRKLNPAKGNWLLTSTPNMEEVIEKNRPKDPSAKKKRQVKKVLFDDGKSNSNKKSTVKSTVAPKKRQMLKRQRQTSQTIDSSSDTVDIADENEDDEDCPCIYCNDLYSRSKPGESWLRCMSCYRWAHASCADVSRKTKRFICELCL